MKTPVLKLFLISLGVIFLVLLAACGVAAPEYEPTSVSEAPSVEEAVETVIVEKTVEVLVTEAPAAEEPVEVDETPIVEVTKPVEIKPTSTPATTPTIPGEEHTVELEWPGQMQYGEVQHNSPDSDPNR